ncbi:MAG TPA: DUF192 domain-containing protein [Armatimonadetes bacterium]|nr:DUF192 domain-containing protein [Armatimonadota bacterium]
MAIKLWPRLWGLMGRRTFEPGEGLWIVPCNSIHMFFVRFPIDVLFLDEELRVLEAVSELLPNRIKAHWRASSVLELPAGTIARTGTAVGHYLQFGNPPA